MCRGELLGPENKGIVVMFHMMNEQRVLFGRKVRMNNGAALDTVISEMKATVEKASGISELSSYAEAVAKSISAIEEITWFLLEKASGEDAYLAYSWATPYLEIFGDIVLGWLFLWQAWKAHENASAASGNDKLFYAGKINTAKFYIGALLPAVYGKIDAIKLFDRSLSQMDESIFIP